MTLRLHTAPATQRQNKLVQAMMKAGVSDEAVLRVMAAIPRELFLSPSLAAQAYDDLCLPIGEQQTISMPSVVAKMTAALGLTGREKVLEIGTGCGYQAAVLAKMCRRVYSIERHAPLQTAALQRLSAMGVHNITAKVGDGTLGWPEQAPFEAIIVTAAGPRIPEALVAQLAHGGRMVIPVGPQETEQRLVKLEKDQNGTVRETILGPVAFVPLIGAQGAAPTRARA
jgi:protein-L-isoaspartate(D-aspartate) O-methyltransferase